MRKYYLTKEEIHNPSRRIEMTKSYNTKTIIRYRQVGTRSSMGIRTRSGRKAFNTKSLLTRYSSVLRNSPVSSKRSSRRVSQKTTPTKRSRVPAKKYKKLLRDKIVARKEEFGLKRASSRIAALYILTEGMVSKRQTEFNRVHRKRTRASLEKELAKNKQPIDGTKKDLTYRVIEGRRFGGMPRCHKCTHGVLDFDFNFGEYSCRGNMAPGTDEYCNGKFEYRHMIHKLKIWQA